MNARKYLRINQCVTTQNAQQLHPAAVGMFGSKTSVLGGRLTPSRCFIVIQVLGMREGAAFVNP